MSVPDGAPPQDAPQDPAHLDGGGLHRPLLVASSLALASGFVDAVVFLRIFSVFPANQSGNLVLLGIAVGDGDTSTAVAHGTALCAYVVGAALGVVAFDAFRRRRPADAGSHHRFLGAVSVEAGLLVVLAGALWATGRARHGPEDFDLVAALAIATAAVAMGLQSIAVRSVRHISALTTGATGNVTSLGVVLARLRDPRARARVIEGVVVLTTILVPYIGGAAVGAAVIAATDLGGVLVVLPAVGLGLLLASERPWVRSRSRTS